MKFQLTTQNLMIGGLALGVLINLPSMMSGAVKQEAV
jgi:hypothetical protein